MKDTIVLTISNQNFNLCPEEAKFLAEHLRTAVAQPNLALNFSQQRSEQRGRIVLSRGVAGSQHETDC
jgi:GGDEF domain-containing protein